MFDTNTAANQPAIDPKHDREQDDPYAGLRSPISLDELARVQGVKPIKSADDLPKWPEDDLDAWEGFDEFLDELRHGTGDLRRWVRGANQREQEDAMSITQPTDPTEDEPAVSVHSGNFWHSPTFEDLARAQGVRPVRKLEDIMGGWPEDQRDDGFEDAIRAMRQEDLQREPSQ